MTNPPAESPKPLIHHPKKHRWRFLFLPSKTTGFIWLATISITLTFFIAWKLPTDPDLFWHVRAGGDILKQSIPRVDWYSHTMSDFGWIDHEYAQEVLMHFLVRLGGFRLISLAYALFITLSLTLGLKWSLPSTTRWGWVFLSAPLVAVLSVSFLGARPQMFTYLFILLLLGLIFRFLKAKQITGIKKYHLLPWIPLLFALWSNLHASFLLGLIILVIVLLTEAFKFVIPRRLDLGTVTSARKVFALAATLIVSLPATFLNPYGPRIWQEIARTLGDHDLHNNILEWFAPNINNSNSLSFFIVILLIFTASSLAKKRSDLTRVALLTFFMLAGFLAVRNMPLFLLLAVPTIVLALRDFWPGSLGKIYRLWPVLLILTGLVPLYVYYRVPLGDLWRFDKDPLIAQTRDHYPAGAAQFLNQHPEFNSRKGFNDYGWGGYLLGQVPYYKTFIDGRMPSWQKGETKIINDYFKIDRQEKGWQELLDKYDITLFITHPDHNIIKDLKNNNHFTQAYKDDTAIILLKENKNNTVDK